MSETNHAPSEQPAPESAPAQTSGAQPEATDHSAAIASLDQDQLGNALFGGGEPEAPASVTVPAEGTPPAAETPAEGAQPAAAATPPAAEAEEHSSLRRLPLGGIPMSERQQMAEVTRMIRDGEAATQIEALTKMGLLQPAAPAGEQPPDATEEAPPAAPTAPTSVLELQTTIDDLRAQRKAAKRDFDEDEEERLDTLISQHERALIRAEIQAESQTVENRSYQTDYLAAVDAMEEKYEWTTNEADPRYQLLDDKVTAAQARKDPALQEPDFILKFAQGIDSIGKPAPAAPPAKPPQPPAAQQRIVGGGVAPGHSEATRLTESEQRTLVHNASKEELAAALFS